MDEKKRDNTPDDLLFEEEAVSSGPVVTSGRQINLEPRKPWATSIKLFIGSILAFLIGVSVLRSLVFQGRIDGVAHVDGDHADEVPPIDKRKPMPDILLVGEGGTQSKKLSDYKGKVVLLSVWASWCTPCLVELPSFMELHEKLADQGLAIVPLNVDEPETAAQFVPGFWKTRKFPFPTFFDPQKEASGALDVQTLPTNLILDKEGRLVAQGLGANDWASETSVKFLETLLRE